MTKFLVMLFRFTPALLIFLLTQAAVADNFEPRLIESLDALQFQEDKKTEEKIESLIADYPNSQTAHLMMADIYAARAGIINSNALADAATTTVALQQLDGLRDEMRLRWNQVTSDSPAQRGLIPASIIELAKIHKTIVFVDTSKARLYVYNNIDGKLSLAVNNYTTIGEKGSHKRKEGDERTPIGVYHITRYIDDDELPPLYGTGAFPINYPNALDKHYKRTGHGIWLHGTHPESFNRVPLASDGCVAMSNPEFDLLKPLISPANKTPVIISDQPNWVLPQHLDVTRKYFSGLLEQWVSDWESRDPAKYLSHYDQDRFFAKGFNYDTWANHKTNVNLNKTLIEVTLSDVSFFAYPSEDNMIVAEFTQQYHSNNFDTLSSKRQYWKLNENDEWKIIYEGRQ